MGRGPMVQSPIRDGDMAWESTPTLLQHHPYLIDCVLRQVSVVLVTDEADIRTRE